MIEALIAIRAVSSSLTSPRSITSGVLTHVAPGKRKIASYLRLPVSAYKTQLVIDRVLHGDNISFKEINSVMPNRAL